MKAKEQLKGEMLAGSAENAPAPAETGRECRPAGRKTGRGELKALGQDHVVSPQGKWRGLEIQNKMAAGQAKSERVGSSLLPRPWVLPTVGHRDPGEPRNVALWVSGRGSPSAFLPFPALARSFMLTFCWQRGFGGHGCGVLCSPT